MGGIIVIDFIDMQEPSNRRKLYQFLKDEMAKDKARHNILPPSKFGLVQITRQRVRPIAEVIVAEKCPTCEGSGEIRSSIIITDEIENNISYLLNEQNEKKIKIQTHPFIHAFLTKKILSKQIEWFVKYKKWIKIKPNTSYHFLEYHFFDKKNEEIKI
jgi:ribonuclease G